MLKRIAVLLTAATVLGVAAPASAQTVYGGWWGGPYGYHRHYYDYDYTYPRHHFFPRHHYYDYGYGYRSWWGGY